MKILLLRKAILTFLLLMPFAAYSQVFLQFDGVTSPYTQLNNKGYYVEETSLHPGFTHVTQEYDNDLKKNVIVFTMHKDIDGDGSERTDRQRLEIKTYGPSPANMKAGYGETHTYRWKFKLDAGFQPSPSFCHIHQLKAGDGDDAGSPLITITPRYASSGDKMQIIHTGPSGANQSLGTVKEVLLSSFKGVWVEAYEKVTYTEAGSYELVIRRMSDDAILMQYSNTNINLWRTPNTTFVRPKYGIYRSLNLPYLRDESVKFADWYLYEGTTQPVPADPTAINGTVNSATQITLAWTDNSTTENLFRIERSVNGGAFTYFASVSANITTFTDNTVLSHQKYKYRVRAENTFGNSAYPTTAEISVAPTVTAAVQSASNAAGQTVIVRSSASAGKVYIILTGVPQLSVANLDAAVTAKNGASATVTASNTDIAISTEGLAAGTYYAYAVNELDIISVKGTNAITISSPSATKNLTADQISFFPVPVTSVLTIDAPENLSGIVYIYHSSGTLVKKINIEKGQSYIDLSDFKAGLYSLKFIAKNGESLVKKIVKQ